MHFKKSAKPSTAFSRESNRQKSSRRSTSIGTAVLSQPSLAAGIVKPENMAGYRQHFLHIQALGTSANWELVPNCDGSVLRLPEAGERPARPRDTRHSPSRPTPSPPDGNGRSGRFIMNTMLASGLHP